MHSAGTFFETLGGEVQDGLHFLLGHVEDLNNVLHRQASFQIFENRLHRHAVAFEDPGSAHFTRSAFDGIALRPVKLRHGKPLFHPTSLA